MNPVKVFLYIVEMRTKVVSMATFACATLASAAWLRGNELPFPWVTWWLMLAAVLAVDMGTTGFNTYFDFIYGVDSKEANYEEAKVLVHNGVSPAQAFFTSLILFAAAVVLGLIITVRTNWLVAFIGFICMLVGFFYSAGPRPISHTPFGEFFSGGFLGCVLFCISWFVLTGNFSTNTLLMSLPLWLMIAGILTTNNNCDLEGDKRAGRNTLTVILGLNGGRVVLWLEYTVAAAILYYLQYVKGIYPRGFIPVSLALYGIIICLFVRMELRGFRLQTKGASMMTILAAFIVGSLQMIYPWISVIVY